MSRRIQKVAELLKQQLALMIIEVLPEELGIVTLTEIIVSKDIKNAQIFISCLESSSEAKVIKILVKKAKEFQHILGRKLQMRYTPKLEFKVDKGLGKVNRVEEILENI